MIIPPKGYLKGLREVCDQNHVLLVLDEIQSGLGRTGQALRLRARGHPARRRHHRQGPLAAASTPSRAFLANDEVMDVFTPGIHGSTYGGNPLACAVGHRRPRRAGRREAGRARRRAGRPPRRAAQGHEARQASRRSAASASGPASSSCPRPAAPASTATPSRTAACSARTPTSNTIRLAPPLVITREQLDWAVDQIEAVLQA